MSATPRWLVTRKRGGAPQDSRLRKAAEVAKARGEEWELLVATPPPVLGRQESRMHETLVVGERAACVRLGRIHWGRWDVDREVVHLDRGSAIDITGRPVKTTSPGPRRAK